MGIVHTARFSLWKIKGKEHDKVVDQYVGTDVKQFDDGGVRIDLPGGYDLSELLHPDSEETSIVLRPRRQGA